MTQHAQGTFRAGTAALLIAALVAAFAIGFAISRGDGEAPASAQALAAAASAPSLAELEEAAKASPKDANAWQRLGLAYFTDNRFADAAQAYGKATAIDAAQPLLWSALGEARVMASARDPMPAEAVSAFERAIALDPKDPRARYFLAVKRDLGGDHAGALDDWLALLAETPRDAPWRADLIRTIEQVGRINEVDVAAKLAAAGERSPAPPAAAASAASAALPIAAQAIPGPSAQDLAAASALRPDEQAAMAQGMVARLENRLRDDPANVQGWVMLMRSRMTLGEPDKAAKALKDALAANPGQAAFLREQAQVLGVAR